MEVRTVNRQPGRSHGVVNFDDYVCTDNGFNNHLTIDRNGTAEKWDASQMSKVRFGNSDTRECAACWCDKSPDIVDDSVNLWWTSASGPSLRLLLA